MSEDLLEKHDLSQIVTISVCVIAFIVLINVGMIIGCMFKKRTKRDRGLFYFFFFTLFLNRYN